MRSSYSVVLFLPLLAATLVAQGNDKAPARVTGVHAQQPADRAGSPDRQVTDRGTDEVFGEMRRHEVRVARIERLQQIYRERNEPGKVAELDQLLQRERTRHQEVLATQRNRYGDWVGEVDRRVDHVRRGATDRAKPNAAEHVDRATDRARASEAGAATDRGTDRPATDRSATDRGRAGATDRGNGAGRSDRTDHPKTDAAGPGGDRFDATDSATPGQTRRPADRPRARDGAVDGPRRKVPTDRPRAKARARADRAGSVRPHGGTDR